MRIETGTFGADANTPGWDLHRGDGAPHTFNSPIIPFHQRFNGVPQVIIGLIELDGGGSSTRVNTYVAQVNDDGFTVGIATWLDTKVWSVNLSWLASGD